jgi:hypothetical protein
MKNDISKLTKEQIEAFIMGVQECTERGDQIDERKELNWIVTEIPSAWSIKAQWIKSVTRFPLVNPMTDKEDIYHYDDYYFQILTAQSKRKLCAEIIDAIEYVNNNEFNED